MSEELKRIERLFGELDRQPAHAFPEKRRRLNAPSSRGVYIILNSSSRVVHVGMTPRARGGIAQRLKNHLYGQSSFTAEYLKGDGSSLRGRYSYKYVTVDSPRMRTLLEAYAVAHLCPEHLGLGKFKEG